MPISYLLFPGIKTHVQAMLDKINSGAKDLFNREFSATIDADEDFNEVRFKIVLKLRKEKIE